MSGENRIAKINRMHTEELMATHFGPLSITMLNDTPLSYVWRVSFLANFFTGPIYRTLTERYQLSRPEFVILFSLSQRSGLVARDISLVTGLPKNSISRAVSDLLAKGLIHRNTDAADKRAKPLTLTATGKKILAATLPLFIERQEAMLAALSEQERKSLYGLLEKLVYAMPNWVNPD